MVTVDYIDLESAFMFVNSGGLSDNSAYISLDTGRIFWVSSDLDGEEDVPDDVETSDRYVCVPDKQELDLGRHLVNRFVEQAMPEDEAKVEAIFRRKGAYRRFKDFLDGKGLLDQWHAFENAAQDDALRKWCAEHQIEVTGKRPGG